MSEAHDAALRGVFRALARGGDGAKAWRLMFISAARGEGVSTLARKTAQACAPRATRAVMLVDLDLLRDSQYRWFSMAKAHLRPPVDGRIKGAAFFRALDEDGRELAGETSRLQMAQAGNERLYLSHFNAAGFDPRIRLQVLNAPAYWDGAREGCDLCVVDAPALSRSRVGLTVSGLMDGVVIVASAERGSADATLALKEELELRGARILGAIYTDADPGAAQMERWLTRFG